jgi:Poxvirus Late Transcription Factor VLTF3 like
MFKEKTSKKRIHTHDSSKDTTTLDARHLNMVQSMQNNKASITDLYNLHSQTSDIITGLQNQIIKYKDEGVIDTEEYNTAWSSNILFVEKRKEIEKRILHLQSYRDEIDYYENTGNILFQYYDIIEKQNTETIPVTQTLTLPTVKNTRSRKKQQIPASINIIDAFKLATLADTSEAATRGGSTVASAAYAAYAASAASGASGASAASNVATNSTIKITCDGKDMPLPAVVVPVDKATLVADYLSYIDPTIIKNINNDALGDCPKCRLEMVCIQHDSVTVCPGCGYQESLLVEQNRPLLRQPNKEASHFSYKRINHFREWCSQVQGKESTDIPEEIFEQILQEIKKEKIQDTRKITYNKMREILKRLRVNKYYEHINYIINRINGVPTPHFSLELEDKLCSMFKEIQGPFLKYCPKDRKNFLSYSYVLYKLFQILGKNEYLKFFQLLKSREKLSVQDQIFKKICEDLGWPFYPSL